jgi:hypothetical protein
MSRDKSILALLFLGLLAARLCHSGIVWVEEAYPTAAAIQLLDGKSLYRDIWFDKPPLSALVYLLWDARIGVTLRIAGAAFVFACCWMLWRFARDLWGPREGLAAALLLGFFLTFGIPAAAMAMAPDLLMVLPHIAAVYLAWRGRPFLSGLVAGVALLVNAKAFFVLAACMFFAWNGAGWLLAGFLIPNIVALIWFGRPYVDQVWRWGALYSEQTFAFSTGFIRTANWAGFQAALVLGAVVVLWKENRWRWKMLAWLLLSLVAVAAGWRFFPRYYFQLLPVMALLAARGYTLLGRYRAILLVLLLIPLARATSCWQTILHTAGPATGPISRSMKTANRQRIVSDAPALCWYGVIAPISSLTPECPPAAASSIRSHSPAYWPTGISPVRYPSRPNGPRATVAN